MAATEIKSILSRMRSFSIFDSMFNFRNIRGLTYLFVVLFILTGQSLADDGYEMDDFLKREYSLTKPYQGNYKLAKLTFQHLKLIKVSLT